jgi:hypothetical protein
MPQNKIQFQPGMSLSELTWLRVNLTTALPHTAPTLRQAARKLASLHAFLGRKCDGEPGTQTLWLGLQRLDDLTHMYRVLTAATGPPGVQRGYGAGPAPEWRGVGVNGEARKLLCRPRSHPGLRRERTAPATFCDTLREGGGTMGGPGGAGGVFSSYLPLEGGRSGSSPTTHSRKAMPRD